MKSFFTLAALASSACAHMMLGPLIAPYPGGDTSPLTNGQAFCKGLQNNANAKATNVQPGVNRFNLAGSAFHGGGSMQASLSFDGGRTFKVVKSFVGGFPKENSNQPTYEFTIPQNAKAGPAIFSWSWSNRIGNREFYQDCAPIVIGGNGASTLNNLPDMFVSNLANVNSCKNAETTAVRYPNPGSQVENGGENLIDPTGSCGPSGNAAAPPTNSGAPATPTPATPSPPAAAPSAGAPPADDDDEEDDEDCDDDEPAAPATPPAGTPATPATPPATGNQYTVKAGDTCYLIGQSQNVDFRKIMSNNPTINAECTNLEVGQVITLRRRSRVMRF